MVIGDFRLITVVISLLACCYSNAAGDHIKYCGQSIDIPTTDPFTDRIVGGVAAHPHEFPWVAKMYRNEDFHCGAALIADRYLITAGHCVASYIDDASTQPKKLRGNVKNYNMLPPNEFIVELGSHHMKEKAWNVLRLPVKKIIIHPDYDVFASGDIMLQTFDVAIIKIPPTQFSSAIAPVCLPKQGARVPDYATLVVAGWGSTQTETITQPVTKLPSLLQKTILTKIPYHDCKKNRFIGIHLKPVNQLTDRELFCMLGVNTDSCRGDSGGPAMFKTRRGYIVSGLVSWGIGCNQLDYPAAYTQVGSFMDFIVDNTRDGIFLPARP